MIKKIYVTSALCSCFLYGFTQSQIVTTGNNLNNQANPYAADIVIGSDANGGARHDSNIMFWSSGSAPRIWNSNDVFNFCQWNTTNANVALNATVGGISYFQGGVGVGTASPPSWAKFSVQGSYALGSSNGSGPYGGVLVGSDGGFYFSSNQYGDNLLSVQSNGLINIGDYVGDANMTFMAVDDINAQISVTANRGFQVNNYGTNTASMGAAYGPALNYGTSYLGFNATREVNNSWSLKADGYHNGGGVTYSNIFGDIYFVPIASTGGSSQTLSDGAIANRIALKVSSNGTTYAKQVVVQLTGFPDYVFKPYYKLMPLSQVKSYIDQHQHLPDVPSAAVIEKNGLDVSEMNKIMMKKIEELTLYLIEKDKQIKTLEYKVEALDWTIKKRKEN